jgi:prepilin-type N-terminal cleavage/methylation domain-containing protein
MVAHFAHCISGASDLLHLQLAGYTRQLGPRAMNRNQSVFMARAIRRRGFTLVEVLVVIVIIGILIALMLPAIQAAREAARRTQCLNNVGQLGLAALNYHDTHKHFPPGIGYSSVSHRGAFGTWQFHLMGYLEEQNLFDSSLGSLTLPSGPAIVHYPGNNKVYSQSVPTFLCPSDPSVEAGGVLTIDGITWGAACYVPNALISAKTDLKTKTTNPEGKTRLADIRDGTAKTILHAEKYARCTTTDAALAENFRVGGTPWANCTSPLFPWLPAPMNAPARGYQTGFAIPVLKIRGAPNAIGPESIFQDQPTPFLGNCDPTRAATAHSGGMVVGLADGSVRILAPDVNGEVWWAAVTPAEGEVLRPDW